MTLYSTAQVDVITRENVMSNSGRSTQQAKVLEQVFGDLPIVDAYAPLRIMVTPADVKGSKKKDPANCALSRACRRQFGSSKVLFFRSKAYVDLPNEDGELEVNRFYLLHKHREAIIHFDKTGEMTLGCIFLSTPTPSQKLSVERRKNERRQQRINQHKQKVNNGGGNKKGISGSKRVVLTGTILDDPVRNGSAYFTKAASRAKRGNAQPSA